jgi:ATP-dependent Clp protease ATP-binding subunit ClpX
VGEGRRNLAKRKEGNTSKDKERRNQEKKKQKSTAHTRTQNNRVMTEPRNAIVRQYQKLFALEKVTLRFTDSAVNAIAKRAVARKTGARGLRAILEEVMLELMYDIPSQQDIKECIVNEDVISGRSKPILIYSNEQSVRSA